MDAGYVWRLYWDIKIGTEDVDLQALAAWQSITGIQFSPFEAEALIEIDMKRRHAK
jgi:hypothetical protein